jgi:ribosomal protein S12 methylthiotransferase accessory factor
MHTERWMDLVSSRVGVIREVAPQGRGPNEPVPPYLYTAVLANFDFRSVDRSERVAAGKGRTQSEAIASAIGEAVERYCAFQWDASRTFITSREALQGPAIDPADCILHSEAQYASDGWRTVRWKPSEPTTWMLGTELPSRAPVAVPASLVYLVTPPPRMEDFFAPASSNGLASAQTLERAVLGAVCELMERDALLICWMNRLPAVEIDLDGSGGTAQAIARHYACGGVHVRAFLLPTDLPASVVMAVSFEDDPARPAQVIGMGCHVDPGIATVKALFEMCQGRPAEARRFADSPPRGRLSRYEDVQTLDDHSAFASLPESRTEFEFLWASELMARVQDLTNPSRGAVELDLEYVVAGLNRLGSRVAYADLTLHDIASSGLRVVRAVATGLQPIHFGHDTARLGGRRLFEVPWQLGFRDRPVEVGDLNPCPHPLA